MTWLAEAEKYTTQPVALVEVDFDNVGGSGTDTRKYSVDYIRPQNSSKYKGNILNLPRIYQSIGDIRRAFEMSRIEIIFSDVDKEFRILVNEQAIKNRDVRIRMSFINRPLATESYVIFTGWIYDYELVDNFHFRMICENILPSLDNEYPSARVNLTDYPAASPESIDWIVPIPYGTISDVGLRDKGAFGHPSMSANESGGGMLLVDDTQDAEIHLVGYQTADIAVPRVYIDGVLKAEGALNDYTIGTQIIDGFTYTEIRWNAGVRPTKDNLVSCDIIFGSLRPVEMVRHFLENFCGYASARFNAAAYAEAIAIEATRGYTADGALWKGNKTLQTILDDWREEFELEIYVDKSGLIVFKYISAVIGTPNTYTDVLDIHPGFAMQAKVDELLNELKYGFNYNYSGTYFFNFDTYEDVDSQTEYGQTYFQFRGFEWIRSATMALDIAARKIVRFKDPITFYTLQLPLKSFAEDLADVIKITHYQGAGSSGFTDKLCQIRAMELDIDEFSNTVRLEDASNYIGAACILGFYDGSAAPGQIPDTWMNAAGPQRDYCYMCDSTSKKFSDGAPGKRLFD